MQLHFLIVKQASLYNTDNIDTFDFHIGIYGLWEKGGEIIPKVVGVNKNSRTNIGLKVSF